jgi:hypothetical protein
MRLYPCTSVVSLSLIGIREVQSMFRAFSPVFSLRFLSLLLECFFDNSDSEWEDSVFAVRIQFLAGQPMSSGSIGGATQRATRYAAEVIYKNVMESHSARFITDDAVENFYDLQRLNFEAGFFEHFASDALLQCLAHLERASRQGPFAFKRLLSTLDEQHLVFMNDDGSNANDRSLWIFAPHQDKIKSLAACRTLRQRQCGPC